MTTFAQSKIRKGRTSLMHHLHNCTKEALRNKFGVGYDEILRMSSEEVDALVEKRIGKKLKPAFSLKGMVNRGSVYLYFKRLISMNEVDYRLSRI